LLDDWVLAREVEAIPAEIFECLALSRAARVDEARYLREALARLLTLTTSGAGLAAGLPPGFASG